MSIDNPLSANYTKWSNTLKQFVGNLPTNCLVIFDHFVQLALKGLRNSSVFPTDYELYIDKSLSNVTLTDNDIGRIISSLDPNKTHRHGRMSIHMLRICEDSIYKHLEIVFRACLALCPYTTLGSFSVSCKRTSSRFISTYTIYCYKTIP